VKLDFEPLVSVIIPSYNGEKYIAETIQSALFQTYRNLEIIVVDDGSTDGQNVLVKKLCEQHNNLMLLCQKNQGVSAARNNGFNHSKGEYMAFLDADDVWLPENLQLKLNKFQNSDFGLVHSDAFLINENSELIHGVLCGKEGALLDGLLAMKGTEVPGPSSILIKREVVNEVGLFDINLSTAADRDFFIRVASKYKIGRVETTTWKYRVHGSNMHKNIALMTRDNLYIFKKSNNANLFHSNSFKEKCYANLYLILSASWIGVEKNYYNGIYFACMAIKKQPILFFKIIDKIAKKIFVR
jgi:glycosyltransferase involved in cell wall biosynthesis